VYEGEQAPANKAKNKTHPIGIFTISIN